MENLNFIQEIISSMRTDNTKRNRSGLVAALVLTLGIPAAHAQILFTDVSAASGVGKSTESYGASWGDINGDGYPDLFANNHRTQCSLFLNKGNGSFFDTGSQVYTWVQHQNGDTHGGSWSDFDNDGDQDLLITTGTGNPSQFLVNEHGELVDRTDLYGITASNVGGRLPVWYDYNGDHLPDFVLAQFGGAAIVYKQVPSALTPSGTTFAVTTTDVKFLCKRFHYAHLLDVTGDGKLDFMCASQEGTTIFPQKIYNMQPFPWVKLFDYATPSAIFPAIDQVVDSIVADFNNDGRVDMFALGGVQLHPSSVVQGGTNDFDAKLSGGSKGFNFISAGAVTFNIDWKKVDESTGIGFDKIKIGATAFSPTSMTFTLDSSDPAVVGMPPAPVTADLPTMHIGYDPVEMRWTLIHYTAGTGVANSEAYYQVSSTAPITSLKNTGLWPSDKAVSPTLLMNYVGGYSDQTVAAGLATPVQCVSASAGDFDNDMDVDLYLVCRTGASNIENILYENQGDGTFIKVAAAGGAGGPIGTAVSSGAGTGESVVSADYDVDGFLDLYVTNGLNLEPKFFGGPTKLFHNQGNGNRWIELDLIGTNSERDAVGARVTATANGVDQYRVKNGNYHRWSQDGTRTHFGLAGSATVDLRVEWPSGAVETFPGVATDTLYRITEGSGIAPVALGIAPAYPCGSPNVNGAVDSGVFVWKDCPSGEWRIRTAAGGSSKTYSGKVTSNAPYVAVTPIGLAASDIVDSTTSPMQIAYTFQTTGVNTDGVNFTLQAGAIGCLKVDAPVGVQVYYGPLRTPLSQPFDLVTQGVCTGLPSELSVSPISVSESAGQANFTVTLTPVSTQTVAVAFATVDGTAISGLDYTGVTGTLTFAPGETSKTVSMPILDDLLVEGNETFKLNLSTPSNAVISAASATGTVVDDDAIMSINNVTVAENVAGGMANFTVSLSVASTVSVSVDVATADGSAVAPGDYTAIPLTTLTFAPGETSKTIAVPIIDDALIESVETFTVNLSNVSNAVLGSAVGTGTVTENELPPVASINNLSVAENVAGGVANLTVSLSAASTLPVSVNFASANGSATNALDYTGVAGTFNFAPGETSKTLAVPVLDDALAEGDETFTVTLSSPVNATLSPSAGKGTAAIQDNETSPCGAPTYSAGVTAAAFVWRDCTSGQWFARMTAGGATSTLKYTGSVTGDAVFSAVMPFSIETGDVLDYTSNTSVISFSLNMSGSGQDGFNFTPPVNSSACFSLTGPAGAAVLLGSAKTPVAVPFRLDTLGPCNPATAVSINSVSALETDANATFTVSLSAPSTFTVTLNYASANGTATGGQDYTAVSGKIVFAPGETSKTVSVPILDDALIEADEKYTLTLSNPLNAVLGTAIGTGTVNDNEPRPVVAISDVAADENVEGGVANFIVSLSAVSTQVVTVDVASADGSAVSPSDYTALPLTTLTFAPGETSKTVVMDIVDDALIEGNEIFLVSLANPVNATLGTAVGTGTVIDDELPPVVSVNDVAVNENVVGGFATFTVSLSATSTLPVTVDVTTADGSAVAPDDYTTVPLTTVTFAPGETSKAVDVNLIDDSLTEGSETFTLLLSSQTNATLGTAVGTGTVLDNDIAVSINDVTVAENVAGGNASFTVSLSSASALTVSVDVATADGSAVASDDYAALPLTTLTFAPGETSKTVDVNLVDDALYEGYETFTVSLSNPVNLILATAVGAGTITDNELPPIASVADVAVDENIAGGVASFTVSLSAASTLLVTVDVTTADGSAVAPGDYTSVPLTTLTFAPGETSKVVDVNLIDDSLTEENETFTLVLSSPTNATLGAAVGTGTVLDDDVAVSINDVTVAENVAGGNASFTVSLSSASALTVSVDVATADGSAVASDDYAALPLTTLTFAPGETSKTVDVNLVDDALYEGYETFTVSLSNPVNLILATAVGAGTITDNELPPIASVADVAVDENIAGGVASFTVSLSTASTLPVTVDVTTADGSAVAPGDYTSVPLTTLTFAPGETSKVVDVNLIDDSLTEENETFTLVLSSPTNATLGTAVGTGTVLDNDIAVSINDVTVAENVAGGVASFTVSLSSASALAVSVDVATTDGSATAPADYTVVPITTLTFAPGETSKTVDVAIIDDSVIEDDQTFSVSLSNPNGVVLGNAIGNGIIIDNDVVVSIDSLTVAENVSGGVANFTVSLSAASTRAVTVDVTTANGSAIAPSDYTALPTTTLTFAPGETSKTVAVAIVNNAVIEGTENFTVVLSNPVNLTLGTAVGTATVLDDDATPVVSISNLSVAENVAGGVASFTVNLSTPTSRVVTVNYGSADGTAKSALDFIGVTGTLSFSPGQTSKTVPVTILDDVLAEGNETFTLNLSNAVNATLSATAKTATGTIADNEISPCGTPTFNAGVTKAVLVWRDCTTGQWFTRVISGGSSTTINYTGTVTASSAFTGVTGYSLETNDTVTTTNSVISYNLHVNKTSIDGFNFTPPATSACFKVTKPANAVVLVGSGMTPVTQPFRLDTLGPC